MSGGNSHLALRMLVKEGKWMCEKTLKVLLSLRKWTKNCSGLNSLMKPPLEEEGYEGALPGDGIIN
jgi:hypothetical protein